MALTSESAPWYWVRTSSAFVSRIKTRKLKTSHCPKSISNGLRPPGLMESLSSTVFCCFHCNLSVDVYVAVISSNTWTPLMAFDSPLMAVDSLGLMCPEMQELEHIRMSHSLGIIRKITTIHFTHRRVANNMSPSETLCFLDTSVPAVIDLSVGLI